MPLCGPAPLTWIKVAQRRLCLCWTTERGATCLSTEFEMSLIKYVTIAIALCTALLVNTANRAAAAGAVMPAALEAVKRASASVATSDVIKVGNRRNARRAARRARRARQGYRGGGRRARRAGRRVRHARRGGRRYHRRHHRRYKRRRARVHIGFYPYYYGGYYPYYYGGYAPYYYGTPTYYTPRRRYRRSGCGYWRRQCRANWGYRNSDYYGCLRYHGCR